MKNHKPFKHRYCHSFTLFVFNILRHSIDTVDTSSVAYLCSMAGSCSRRHKTEFGCSFAGRPAVSVSGTMHVESHRTPATRTTQRMGSAQTAWIHRLPPSMAEGLCCTTHRRTAPPERNGGSYTSQTSAAKGQKSSMPRPTMMSAALVASSFWVGRNGRCPDDRAPVPGMPGAARLTKPTRALSRVSFCRGIVPEASAGRCLSCIT